MKRVITAAVLLSLILIISMPGAALAAPVKTDFSATATIEYIGEGTVKPRGNIWLVRDRPMVGSIYGDVTGTYELVYGGVIRQDQSGPIKGPVAILTDGGDISGTVSARLDSIAPIGIIDLDGDGIPNLVCRQHLYGTFKFMSGTDDYEGTRGHGTVEGDAYPVLDEAGVHVVRLCDGTIPVFYFDGNTGYPTSAIQLDGWIRL